LSFLLLNFALQSRRHRRPVPGWVSSRRAGQMLATILPVGLLLAILYFPCCHQVHRRERVSGTRLNASQRNALKSRLWKKQHRDRMLRSAGTIFCHFTR